MIRTILSDALRLAADALDTHPAPERWEAELDALRQQIGDLDAAISDRSNATELIDRLCKSLDADGLYMAVELAERLQRRDSERDALDGEIGQLKADLASNDQAHDDFVASIRLALGPHMDPLDGTVASVAALVAAHRDASSKLIAALGRLDAAEDAAMVAQGDPVKGAEAEELRAGIEDLVALFNHSVPCSALNALLDRVNARDSNAHLAQQEDLAHLTTRLDAARDGLKAARTCLARLGVPLLGDAITAVERGLAKSASSLSDITTPKPSDAATPDPTAEQIEAYLRGSVEWVAQTHSELPMGRNWWEHHVSGTGVRITNANGGDALGWIAEAEGVTLAEMRARILGAGKVAAEAAEPTLRDIAEDPRPGDLFVDEDGCTWFCIGPRAYVLRNDEAPFISKNCGIRPATPEEVAKFRKDHNL